MHGLVNENIDNDARTERNYQMSDRGLITKSREDTKNVQEDESKNAIFNELFKSTENEDKS